MKKSDTGELTQAISKLRSNLSPLFPVELPFDSTGGKRELQPLRAHAVLNAGVILAKYLLAGLVVLFFHFNTGIWVSVPMAIAILWLFAMQRDMPPAPLNVNIKFWSDGSLCIESDDAWVYLNDVGPVWTQDGLVFALAHDYEKKLEGGGKHAVAILPLLQSRAAKLGVEPPKPADIRNGRMEMVPGKWTRRERGPVSKTARLLCSRLLEQAPGTSKPVPVLLGQLLDADDVETSERNRKMLAYINLAACLHMHELLEQHQKTDGRTPDD